MKKTFREWDEFWENVIVAFTLACFVSGALILLVILFSYFW